MASVILARPSGASMHFAFHYRSAAMLKYWGSTFGPVVIFLGKTGIDPSKTGKHEDKKRSIVTVVLRALMKGFQRAFHFHLECNPSLAAAFWVPAPTAQSSSDGAAPPKPEYSFCGDAYVSAFLDFGIAGASSSLEFGRNWHLALELLDHDLHQCAMRSGDNQAEEAISRVLALDIAAMKKFKITHDFIKVVFNQPLTSLRVNRVTKDTHSSNHTGNNEHSCVACDEFYEKDIGQAGGFLPKNMGECRPFKNTPPLLVLH
jgi:hypothetical protein